MGHPLFLVSFKNTSPKEIGIDFYKIIDYYLLIEKGN